MSKYTKLFHITCALGAVALMALSQNSMGTAYAGQASSRGASAAAAASKGCTGKATCYTWTASKGSDGKYTCSDNPPDNAKSTEIECLGPAGNECPGSGGKNPNGSPKDPNMCKDKCKEAAPASNGCYSYTKPGSHGGPTSQPAN